MNLIALKGEPLHHVQDHTVVIASYLVAAVFLRPEIAGNAKLQRIAWMEITGEAFSTPWGMVI